MPGLRLLPSAQPAHFSREFSLNRDDMTQEDATHVSFICRFFFGFTWNVAINLVMKTLSAVPRPHFIATCNPDWTLIDCDKYKGWVITRPGSIGSRHLESLKLDLQTKFGEFWKSQIFRSRHPCIPLLPHLSCIMNFLNQILKVLYIGSHRKKLLNQTLENFWENAILIFLMQKIDLFLLVLNFSFPLIQFYRLLRLN